MKWIKQMLTKNNKVEKNKIEIAIEPVRLEKSYHVNTPYMADDVYYAFYNGIHNGIITDFQFNEKSISPTYFKGTYKGLSYKVSSRKPQTWVTTYHVELKDGESGEVLAVSGDHNKELRNAFGEKLEFDNTHFYTLYPNTSIETYIFELLKDLIEINHKASVVYEDMEKSEINKKTNDRKKAKQDLLKKYERLITK